MKKIETIGDIVYHSKKHRYLQLYVPTEQVEETMQRLSKEKYVKQVRICHIQELENKFCHSMHRRCLRDFHCFVLLILRSLRVSV